LAYQHVHRERHFPLSAVTAIGLPIPAFHTTTASTPLPPIAGTLRMPLPLGVFAIATMSAPESGTQRAGVQPQVHQRAGTLFAQFISPGTSVGSIGALGVNPNRYVWTASGGASTGVSGVVTSWFVAKSVT